VRHRDDLTGEWAATEARVTNLLQCKLVLEIGQTTVKDRVERYLPTFAWASKNVAMMAKLLDALSSPSTDGVGKMYQ
jgi:hypothetical protein